MKGAAESGTELKDGGVYTCINGPQFETAAEARMLAALGGTLAGMTMVPEVKLTRELGICYAAVNLVVNRAGDTREHLTHQNTVEVMAMNLSRLAALITATAGLCEAREACACSTAPKPFCGMNP